jgi:hypothetical protein
VGSGAGHVESISTFVYDLIVYDSSLKRLYLGSIPIFVLG